MADGNLGSLWMSLGLKDAVSDGLKKIQKTLDKTDAKSANVNKEINSFLSTLKGATVPDSFLKSLGRIGEILNKDASGVKGLGKLLESLDTKSLALLGGKINMSNLNEAHALITKIMTALSNGPRSKESIDQLFNLGNAQAFLTQIMSIDKNLKGLKDNAKGISDKSMLEDAKARIAEMTNLRKKFLESFNSGNWNGNNSLQTKLSEMTNGLISFYDKLNASKGNLSLFDNVTNGSVKATESLEKVETQAKKTAEAIEKLNSAPVRPMKEAAQEASFFKDVDKIINSKSSIKEGQNEVVGLKKDADNAKKSIEAVKYELNEMLNAFRGAASKKLGIAEAGEKGRQYVDILNQINKKVEEWKRKEGGEANAALIDQMSKNALSYLRLLQRIDNAERSIGDKKSANPNVDPSRFKEALGVISHFREQLKELENSKFLTGVDSANVLGRYAQSWTMALGQVDEIIGKFQKRNPLSDLDSNFSKIDAKIDGFREKLAKLRDLMSEGTRNGYNTSMLGDRITGMSGVIAQMEKALANDGKILSNADRMKQLFNDMQVEMSKATAATQAYGREKGKVIAQEREHNKAIKEHNAVQSGDNKRVKALSEIEILLKNIQNLTEKSFRLGVDVNNINSVRSEIEAIKNALGSISGKDLAGQPLKDILGKLSEVKVRTNDILKTQSVLNKDAETRSATINRYKTDISEYVKAVERESEALLKNKKIRESVNSQKSQLDDWMMRNYRAGGYFGDKSAIEKEIKNLEQGIAQKKQIINDYYLYIVRKNSEIASLTSKAKAFSPLLNGRDANGTPLSGSDLGTYKLALSWVTSLKDELRRNTDPNGFGMFYNMNQASKDIAELTDKLRRANEVKNSLRDNKLPTGNAEIEKELSKYKSEIIRKNEELISSEKRMAEQIAKTNAARRESITASRLQAESLVRDRIKELEAQRQQIQGLFGKGKNVLSEEELNQIKSVFSQLTQELNTLRSAMNNLGGYSIKELFSMSRGSSDFSPLISSVDTVIRKKQESIELERKHQQEVAKTGAKIQSDLVRGFERANSHAGKLNSTIQDLKSLFLQGGLVFGAQQFAMSIITTGGEMEKQHIALQSILGDMQNANTLFGQIKELALNSPFTFSELNRDVKQLAAYGVEYDKLYDTTKRLADMSSGLGVSFDRIALAFGQVQARGWLDGKELRQIAYAGIPLLNKLSEFYSKQEGRNVSTSEIKTRISNREVSFDDVKSIFWQMTDAGGQFYNMQQTLSETLLGRYNKLKDAWEIMLSDFASGKSVVGGTFKFIIDQMTNLVQLMHTFSPMVIGLFSGFALKKASTLLAGSAAANFLTNKEKIAQDIKARALAGQQLSQTEIRILATKRQITREDLQTLVAAKAITKTELQRLYLSGKISGEMYKQAVTSAGMNNFWTNFANKGGVAISLLGKGLGSMFSSLWAMIGGLPGLILTAVTVGIGYAVSKYQELSRAIEQTKDELSDRLKQIKDFKDANIALFSKAISSGDEKEIDNLIDAYKEKLKELAPYNFENLAMKADEKKSHIERLKFLDQELEKLREAEKLSKIKLDNRSNYSGLKDAIDYANQFYDNKDKLTYKYIDEGVNKEFARKKAFSVDKYADFNANQIKDRIKEIFGDISKDDTLRLAAEQSMSSVFSALGVPEDRANEIRASVLQAFGIGDKDSWLQSEVRTKMMSLIDETFPEIGAKIRASVPLTDAEKAKVKELMDDAKKGLINKYPELESTLQGMLAKSKFQAVIDLVFRTDDKFNDLQSELTGRIPDFGNSLVFRDTASKYRNFAKTWGKENSWYAARNAAKSDIDAAYNEYTSAVKSKAKDVDAKKKAWTTVRDAAKTLLFYDYSGEGKKSNKPKKEPKGSKEDKQLKDLKDRISLYKKMYAEIKKYKELFGKGALGQLANDGEFKFIFSDKKSYPISDYTNYETSIKEMLKGYSLSTNDRKNFYNDEMAGIQSENRKMLADQRSDELNVLNKQLDVIQEQYDTYKKIYELTGNKNGAQNVAFGGTVQYDTYKKFLEAQLDVAVRHDNVQSGLSFSTDAVMKMSLENVKDQYGENTRVYDIRKKLEDENNKIKKETIDLMAELIQKNATIKQQIEDENRNYERQLELIKGIEDPKMRQRAKEGAEKTHNENSAKLQFEQFKQESDWVTIFDDLNRVGTSTINTMIDRIDEFSKTTGLSVEVVKQLRDALDKLRTESIERSPLPFIFGGTHRGNTIGDILKNNRKVGAEGIKISDAQAKKTGLVSGQFYTNNQLQNEQKKAYNDSSKAISAFAAEVQALQTVLEPVINLFRALGEEDSILGKTTSGMTGAFGAAASTKGAFDTLGKIKGFGFLENAGPYAAAASAGLSVASSLISAFGADYSSYNKAKAEYDNLTSVWDSLISKKTEYMNIHWGTEATEASKEAQRMLQAEIEETKIVAKQLLGSGASSGSHSIGHRIWNKYGYDGKSWKDVAPEIASRYGVQFNGIEDLLNMDKEVLTQIKTDYTGFWANLDGDYRDYLEKLIEYGDKADEMVENLTEKLTGNKFSSLVESWGDAMASMANSSDNLVDNFENNLKKTILNSMIENIYGDKIKALLAKTQKYAENGDKITDSNGNVISEYTGAEYADVKESTGELSKQIEATRDYLKKTYGWSDNSSSSSTNSIKGITEETADLLASYVNSIRQYCSVDMENITTIKNIVIKEIPELSEIAKSQLTQLNQIAKNTLRSADAAEHIDNLFNSVINGTKKIRVN